MAAVEDRGVAVNAPKPTALKRLEGNPGKRPLNRHEPQPRVDSVYCPRWLSQDAKREWRRVAPELTRLGLLTLVDRAALAAYCEAYAEWLLACRALTEGGYTFTTDKGYVVPHPMVGIKQKALDRMRAFMTEFGMTPSSRSRIVLPPQEPDNPVIEFLRTPRISEAIGELSDE